MQPQNKTIGFDTAAKRAQERSYQNISKKEAVSVMLNIVRQARSQARIDIEDWKKAKQAAENPLKPNRRQLIGIYQDAVIDGHLYSQMQSRIMRVTNKKFKIVDATSGQEDEEKTKLLKTKWFKDFCWFAMESVFFGFSLVEFKDLNEKGQFKKVKLVYREHVRPESSQFVVKVSDDKGINFTEPPYSNWCLGIGDTEDLGLLLQLSIYAIYKKHTWSSWEEFEEMFGIPIRIAKTASTDARVKAEMQGFLEDMGKAAWGIFPEGTELDIKESTRTDAFQVFEAKRKACNEEMSLLINGHNSASEQGGSYSKTDALQKTESEITADDMDDLQYLVNDDLLPLLRLHGYPFSENDAFAWDQEKQLNISERWKIDNGILNHFDVDPKYIEETYGVTILGKKTLGNDGTEGTDGKKPGKQQ